MADKGEAKDPEIILLDDDDDPLQEVPAKEPVSADEPAKLTETPDKPAEEIEETSKPGNNIPVDVPAENKGASEEVTSISVGPSTSIAPVPLQEKADEVMEVDDDSDLELIAEVPVKKDAPTEKRKDAPTETKQDAPPKKMMTSTSENKKVEAMKIEHDEIKRQQHTPDATIPFTFVAKSKDEAFTAINLTSVENLADVATLKEALDIPIKDEKPDLDKIKKEAIKVLKQLQFNIQFFNVNFYVRLRSLGRRYAAIWIAA
jgi:hypothetical protein